GPLEPPGPILRIALADGASQCIAVTRGKRATERLVLVDGIVDFAAHKNAGVVQHPCNQAGAGPLQSRDDEGATRLARGLIDDEALVHQVGEVAHTNRCSSTTNCAAPSSTPAMAHSRSTRLANASSAIPATLTGRCGIVLFGAGPCSSTRYSTSPP